MIRCINECIYCVAGEIIVQICARIVELWAMKLFVVFLQVRHLVMGLGGDEDANELLRIINKPHTQV